MNIMEDLERKWKPIDGYEGIYDLRDDGLLYSHYRNRYTYGNSNGKGYLIFGLSKNRIKTTKSMHQWVWITFVGEIPKGYDIHHINGNPKDNRVENLCLIESSKHKSIHLKEHFEEFIDLAAKVRSKAVLQYTKDGKFIDEYKSESEASRHTGINQASISLCCKGERQSAGGYKWKYK